MRAGNQLNLFWAREQNLKINKSLKDSTRKIDFLATKITSKSSKAKINQGFKNLTISRLIYQLSTRGLHPLQKIGEVLNRHASEDNNSRCSEMSYTIIWATLKWWKWNTLNNRHQIILRWAPMFTMTWQIKLLKGKFCIAEDHRAT